MPRPLVRLRPIPLLLTLWVLVGLGARTARAAANLEVVGSTTRLELRADGSALLRYELTLTSRSGSFERLAIAGADLDAQPLADASVSRLGEGNAAAGVPLPVELTADGGRLELTLPPRQPALSGKSFRLEFGYVSQLYQRGLLRLQPGSQRAELDWIGPEFEQGVDSAALIVRLAHAPLAPEATTGDLADGVGGGLVASTLRRGAATDEIEIVRPHVAQREAPVWRVLVDASALPALPRTSATRPRAERLGTRRAGSEPTLGPAPAPLLPVGWGLLWLGVAGAGYALLVAYKSWTFERACLARGGRARALLPWPTLARATAAGASLAGFGALVLWADAPGAGSLVLCAGLVCAALREAESEPVLRGPGHWQTLESSVFDPVPSVSLPGACLDLGRLPGCAVLVASLGVLAAFASALFARSPYHGACLWLASSALLPVFCTGRVRALPLDLLAHSRRWLRRAERRLSRNPDLVIKALGRFCTASRELDELRLTIAPARGLPGLIALELALEPHSGLTGQRAEPVLVIRAAEGSACQLALPRQLAWTRGRSVEERAALLRPKLPTLSLTVALIQEVLEALGLAPDPAGATASKNARRSSGKALSTAKAGTRASPAHAT